MKRKPTFKHLEPGEYAMGAGPEAWCYCKCPKCGKLAKIIKAQHYINYLGELNPKVTCPYGCGFNGEVVLEEWVPEAKGSA